MEKADLAVVDDSGPAGTEIKITPEMMRAGIEVMRRFGWADGPVYEAEEVREIFSAMIKAAPEGALG